ncbi:MAG: (d)CMP kinase [Gammaproteobacteria bacterium]|nr:(d)CMP kinase [Gammaproteobacteria bacterium]
MKPESAVPVVALDGPAGAGKGTVGRALALRLGWHYLDSGALYRIAALAALRAALDKTQTAAIAALIPGLEIEFRGGEAALDGKDVSRAIRGEGVGAVASAIAAEPAVREALVARQRAFRRPPGLVADGRDMGTVVFADAVLKIFLTASPGERARRRYKQLKEQGIDVTLPRLERELRRRDAQDAGRKVAPLKMAGDAVMLDTDRHAASWAVEQIVARLAEAAKRGGLSMDLEP